jgi:hypothetical protein
VKEDDGTLNRHDNGARILNVFMGHKAGVRRPHLGQQIELTFR